MVNSCRTHVGQPSRRRARIENVYRPPDHAFAGLPDFPFEPTYLQWDGLRHAFIGRALCLPKEWTDDPKRMEAAHVPDDVSVGQRPTS
jgi:hypothetical protein